MILSAHQPCYAPYLPFWAKIASADTFAIFDVAQYERHSWENRVNIAYGGGELLLTVPVALENHFKSKASDVHIVHGNWSRKHCRSIELAYQKAPYFTDYFPPISSIIMHRHERLHGLNIALMQYILFALKIKTKIVMASEYVPRGTKSELVLDLCRKMGATKYLFGSQGRGYADTAAFNASGIEVEFQKYTPTPYRQLGEYFIPNLSVIDLLMCEGPNSLAIIMSGNGTEAA